MHSIRKQLPQLDRLIAFEAAARHLSFTLAAGELNLTQSAVSQQIRALEAELGVALFERRHRSIRLTRRGEEFLYSVSVALMHLARGASELRAGQGGARLTVTTDNSFAGLWLMPRLARFVEAQGEVALRLTTTDAMSDWFAGGADVAITVGEPPFDGAQGELLFAEEVFPVCAPDYLARRPIDGLEDLVAADLLDLEFERWDWMNWSVWLASQNAPAPSAPRRLRANNYAHVIAAATSGLGVALGWRRLVDDALLAGLLVRPPTPTLTTRLGYHVLTRAGRPPSQAVDAFVAWLRDERDRQTLAD